MSQESPSRQSPSIGGVLWSRLILRHWRREPALTLTLAGILALGVAVFLAVRLANNLNVRIPGVDGQSLLATLSADGLALSSGSACSSENPRPSHVLLALGLTEDEARASLRFGLSRFTTEAEIDEAAKRIVAGVVRLRSFTGGEGLPLSLRRRM